MTITIHPERISQFANPQGAEFCLVTNPELFDSFEIASSGGYSSCRKIAFEEEGTIASLLSSEVPEVAHVLVVSPNVFFRSPEQEDIGPRRKILAMACNSTPTPLDAVEHFLRVIENTDANEQEAFADRFFERVEGSAYLRILDPTTGTKAVFQHLARDYTWNQQAGVVDWGEQQIAPSGEISVLPADIWDFRSGSGLAIDGELTFYGLPILHSGEPSFLRQDQVRIWQALSSMQKHALIATVRAGFVTDVRAVSADGRAASEMLERMFAVDSRYCMIEELGFAINTALELLPGNYAMNEVYGGCDGVLHIGLGLTPYTQYHLDIICPGTYVEGDNGLVHGSPGEARVDAAR